jgi:hypothetical protein
MRHPTQMERFESNWFMQMPQHCRLHNKQSLIDRMRWFICRFLQNWQNFAVKIV